MGLLFLWRQTPSQNIQRLFSYSVEAGVLNKALQDFSCGEPEVSHTQAYIAFLFCLNGIIHSCLIFKGYMIILLLLKIHGSYMK